MPGVYRTMASGVGGNQVGVGEDSTPLVSCGNTGDILTLHAVPRNKYIIPQGEDFLADHLDVGPLKDGLRGAILITGHQAKVMVSGHNNELIHQIT